MATQISARLQEMMFLYSIHQNSKRFYTKSALDLFRYPEASKKTRAEQLITCRVNDDLLGALALPLHSPIQCIGLTEMPNPERKW